MPVLVKRSAVKANLFESKSIIREKRERHMNSQQRHNVSIKVPLNFNDTLFCHWFIEVWSKLATNITTTSKNSCRSSVLYFVHCDWCGSIISKWIEGGIDKKCWCFFYVGQKVFARSVDSCLIRSTCKLNPRTIESLVNIKCTVVSSTQTV